MRRVSQNRVVALVLALVFAASCLAAVHAMRSSRFITTDAKSSRIPASLSELLNGSPEALGEVDIARINLLCSQGLPGAEGMDLNGCLAQLDIWAARVRSETERHEYRFRQNPSEFEHSDGFFRMLFLAVVLAEDFQVKYVSAKIGAAAEASSRDGFFKDSQDVFLHGVLGSKREGTCSSLPVLYVAVGRRLGYPLKLATTKGHLFVRWEDSGERFNIEVAGNGVNRFSDDYYRQWPFEITDEEVKAEGHLKSLTPAEELAVFLSIRGMCLQEAGRYAEAAAAFGAAAGFAPGCRSYGLMQSRMVRKAGHDSDKVSVIKMEGETRL